MQSLENLLVASLAIVTLVHDLAHCELACSSLNSSKQEHASVPVVGGIVDELFSDQAGDIVLICGGVSSVGHGQILLERIAF
jgi:hypothetical protein